VQRAGVGDVLAMEVWRKGEILTLQATIVESGGATFSPAGKDVQKLGKTQDAASILRALGIQARDLSYSEQQRGFRGVLITGMVNNSLGAEYLQAGDLIVAVNNTAVNGTEEFFSNLAASAAVQTTTLQLIRGDQGITVTIPAFPREP
jgi:PDZ domain-containing secreted protein